MGQLTLMSTNSPTLFDYAALVAPPKSQHGRMRH
jgi:hypothetical protein